MYKDLDSILSCGRCDGTDNGSRARRSCGCTDGCSNSRIGSCSRDNTQRSDGCNKGRQTWGLVDHPLAMVYSPLQGFDKLFNMETALNKGTMFEELDLPFMGESVYKGGNCRG